jgi:hypothetical protein
MKTIIITEKQIKKVLKSLINEADYSLHKGDLSNANKPYGGGIDSLYKMRHRDTGNFGSGTYLSTYKNIDEDLYNDFILNKNYDGHLTKVSDKYYVIDLDKYNLYKPKDSESAEFLFKTLQVLNDFFYSICSLKYNGSTYDGMNDRAKIKLRIVINNLKYIRLKLPPYKNFINIVKTLCNDKSEDKNKIPTLATIIMEYNGYNGVNVNNIEGWDNTIHGSVIYDLNKFEKSSDKQKYYYYRNNIDKNSGKIYSEDNPLDFAERIKDDLTPIEINSIINSLYKPLNILDWYNLEKKLEYNEITNEIFNHIKKVYPIKLKKLIIDGVDTKDITDYDILSIIKVADFNFINKYLDIYEIFDKIWNGMLFNNKEVKNFISSIDRDKLKYTDEYDKILK